MSDWITKREAAKRLATSVRTVERNIRDGKIQTLKKTRPGSKAETLVHAGDVDALRPEAFLVPAGRTQTAIVPTHAKQPQQAENALFSLLEKLATIATIATPTPAADAVPPWLKLDQAAATSGLSRRLVRDLIKSGDVVAIKDGRSWKVSTTSLMNWTPAKR